MNTTSTPCPRCGEPMRRITQPALIANRPAHILEDCNNPLCALYRVTLTSGEHARLTPPEVAQYKVNP